MAHIPKGVLEKFRWICFRFLWFGRKERDSMAIVKSQVLSKPREAKEWGLKNIHIFGPSLAAKSLWRDLTHGSLWRRIIDHNYFKTRTVLDWIRTMRKSVKNYYNQCKAFVLSFPVIGRFLAWKVGQGDQVRIGTDAVLVWGERMIFPGDMLTSLQDKGFTTLNQIGNPEHTTL